VRQPYVDGITAEVSHNLASSLTAGQIAAAEDTVSVSVVCPDRWFLGDFAVVTSRDGHAFAGEVDSMDVCTGEVTIRRGEAGKTERTPRLSELPTCSHVASLTAAPEASLPGETIPRECGDQIGILDEDAAAALIVRSSLGTPTASRIRRGTSPGRIAEILRRRDQLQSGTSTEPSAADDAGSAQFLASQDYALDDRDAATVAASESRDNATCADALAQVADYLASEPSAEERARVVFRLPRQLVGEGTLFLLKVADDSMMNAAITDGDWVVGWQQEDAEDGEIVAAMLDGEAMVKTFRLSDGHVRLIPDNPAYTPILGDEATILGKVVALLRRVGPPVASSLSFR
jgi:SOS-response transcriptional repressor LexA